MRLIAVLLAALALAPLAHAKSPAKKPSGSKKKPAGKKKPPAPKKAPPFPCGALPWRPILLTSRVLRDGELATVTQELLVEARSPTAKGEDPRVFVSFGAPGLPRSLRVEFASLKDGELAFPHGTLGRSRALVYAQAPESDGACTVLGRERESGVVVQLPRDLAVDPGTQLGVLRIEQTVALGKLPNGGHDLVLRLASFEGAPVRTGPVQSKERASLELCSHGQPAVPIPGSPLFQAALPGHNLCVTYTK